MLSSVLSLGLESIDKLAAKAAKSRTTQSHHPLAAYPRLYTILVEAEKSGALEAERRRLLHNRLAA